MEDTEKKVKSCTWLISCSDVLICLFFIISFLSIGAMTCTVQYGSTALPILSKAPLQTMVFFLQKGKKNHAPFFQCYCIKIDVSLFQKLFFQVNKFSLLFFVLFFNGIPVCLCARKKYNVVICLLNAIYSLCRHHDNRSLWERKIIRGMRAVYLIRLEEKKICNDSRVVCMCSSTIPSDPSIAEVRNPNGVHLDRCCVSSWPTMAESGAW